MPPSVQVLAPKLATLTSGNRYSANDHFDLDHQARFDLNSLLHLIREHAKPAELLLWKLDLTINPQPDRAQIEVATKRNGRLGRLLGKLWLKDKTTIPASSFEARSSADFYQVEVLQGCPCLTVHAMGQTGERGADNHAPLPLLATIDEEWQKAVARFSVRFGPRWTVTAEDLQVMKAGADAFTQRYATYSGLILTHGLASVAALLAAVRPYVPIETGLNLGLLREDNPAGRMLAMAFREAPAVIATNRDAFDALRQLGVGRLHILLRDASDIGEEKTRAQIDSIRNDVLGQNAENYSSFDSLCQKRMELPYEAASVEDYDSKYHGGTAYQIMDQKLVDIIAENVNRLIITNPRILDLGCGPGSLVNRLRTIPGVQLTGVDLVPEMIQAAHERYPDIHFLVDDAESLSFPKESFDVVLCSGMLHHLPTLTMAMHEILRVLKPNGLIVAREPNEDNFSARQPQLAYAHLCLRHYLFHALGTNPIVEPEAHKYHKSFTFDGFVEEMAKYAYVERLHTDLMVSYFYDEVITHPDAAARMAQLDDTLIGQPGLNVVVVARKCDQKGIDPVVLKSVAQMKQLNPVSVEHYRGLAQFAAEIFTQHPIEQISPPALTQDKGVDCLEQIARRCRKVLLIGDNPSRLQRLKREWELKWGSQSEKNEDKRSLITTYCPSNKARLNPGIFDGAMVVVDKELPAKELKKALDSISVYGWIYVELAPEALITAMGPDEERFFASLPIAGFALNQSGFRLRGAINKFIHSDRDFYKALSVALNIEIPRTPEGNRKAYADILYSCEDELRKGTFPFLPHIPIEQWPKLF